MDTYSELETGLLPGEKQLIGDTTVAYVETFDHIMEFKRWLSESRNRAVLAVDTETTGLDVHAPDFRIRLIQFGTENQAWVINAERWAGLGREVMETYRDSRFALHNCLGGDTEVITDQGTAQIKDLPRSQPVTLWTGTKWQECYIKQYAAAPTYTVTLRQNKSRYEREIKIVATGNHRWKQRGGSVRTTEEMLSSGYDNNVRGFGCVPASIPTIEVDEQSEGFLHGMIYADGALHKQRNKNGGEYRHQIRLCGWKEKYKDHPVFDKVTYPDSYDGDPMCYVYNSFRSYKELPTAEDSPAYRAAFIAGWTALDGVKKHYVGPRADTVQVSTIDPSMRHWLETYAADSGWLLTGSNKRWAAGSYTGHPIEVHNFSLTRDTTGRAWTVKSIEPTGKVEVVYCPKVDGEETFALAPGILTMNSVYDASAMLTQWSGFEFPWDNTDDTMILHRLYDSEKSAALKTISRRLFGAGSVSGQDALDASMRENNWTWATVPYEAPGYRLYSGVDTLLTARLWRRLKPRFANSYVAQLEHDIARIVTEMMLRGIRVDLTYTSDRYGEMTSYADQVSTEFAVHGINIRSNTGLAKHFRNQGAVLDEYTPSGQLKMDRDVLKGLVQKGYTDAQQVLDYRKAAKLAATYFSNIYELGHSGVLHPSINQIEAKTSRMSISSPSLQNLPRGDGMVRNCFIPHEGEQFVSADFSSIELRLTACLTDDENLLDAFREADGTGGDFFTTMGKKIYGSDFQKSDPRRTLVKNVCYGASYGAGVDRLALSAGVPVAVMEPVAQELFMTFHGIRGIVDQASTTARHNGELEGSRPFIVNPYGRRIYVDADNMYQAANYLIQSTAADELKRAMVRVDYAGLGQFCLLPIHDELLLSVPKEDVAEVLPLVEEAMAVEAGMGARGHEYKIPIPVNAEGPHDRWEAK